MGVGEGRGDVGVYGGCGFGVFKRFEIDEDGVLEEVIGEGFGERGSVEGGSEEVGGMMGGRIENGGVG